MVAIGCYLPLQEAVFAGEIRYLCELMLQGGLSQTMYSASNEAPSANAAWVDV